jgi:hypothetical protein
MTKRLAHGINPLDPQHPFTVSSEVRDIFYR